ncbi:hypothetical protein GCM10020220_100530 [Nonomuraea rubra]
MRTRLVEVVVPVHNEQRALRAGITRLQAYLARNFPYGFRITIADNASTDNTWQIATELARELPDVRAVHLDEKGRGRALRRVWSQSEADVVSYMDVDLSTDLDAFLPLVAPLLSGHSDVALQRPRPRLRPGAWRRGWWLRRGGRGRAAVQRHPGGADLVAAAVLRGGAGVRGPAAGAAAVRRRRAYGGGLAGVGRVAGRALRGVQLLQRHLPPVLHDGHGSGGGRADRDGGCGDVAGVPAVAGVGLGAAAGGGADRGLVVRGAAAHA